MPTTDQKSDLLFKKYLGKGSSGTSSLYFNEPFDGRSAVFPVQIWQDQSLIPLTAASVPNVVEQVSDLVLTQVPGQPFAFYNSQLRDAIPFNYDFSGSYVPVIHKSDSSVIAFGENDWVIDIETGMLTFYAGLPSGVSEAQPPKVTFWKYIGGKGIPTGSATSSWAESASWSETASYALVAESSLVTVTSSYTEYARIASSSFNSILSTQAITAMDAISASHAEIADYAYGVVGLTNGTSSWSVKSLTASYALRSDISTFANTSSFAYFAQVTLGTASYAFDAVSSSYASHAASAETVIGLPNGTASWAIHAISSSHALRSDNAIMSTTASYAIYAEIALGTSSYAIAALSSSYAYNATHADTVTGMTNGTSSWALRSVQSISASSAENANLAETASYALYAQIALGTSSYAMNSLSSSWAGHAAYSETVAGLTNGTSSWSIKSINAISASLAENANLAETASYALYAQIALGTSSYALSALSSSWAGHAAYSETVAGLTNGTSSWSIKSINAISASLAERADLATTASYALFSQVTLGTSSYAFNSMSSSYASFAGNAHTVDGLPNGTASWAIHSLTSSFAGYAAEAGHSSTANAALDAAQAAWATEAGFTSQSFQSVSASYADTASYVNGVATASYALTASYFDGSVSGSSINIGLPTDGYYGSGSQGNIAALTQGDKLEDALDKLDVILDKLVPTRPPGLNTKTFQMASSYSARKAGTNAVYTNVTDIQTSSFTMVGGEAVTNAFSNGDSGTLTALIDGASIGSKVLTAGDDTGTYDGLQIVSDSDYYAGQSGKSGFWNALIARINVQSAIDDDLPHTASMSHTLTGTATAAYFYVDNPQTPGPLFGDVAASGVTYISGVPAFVGGVSSSAVAFAATASFGFTWRFYNSTRVFAGSGTGITATNCPLPSSPAAGSILSGSWSAPILAGSTSENAAYTITAYNSKGGTATLSFANTHYRLDSTLDTTNRVTSGVGQYPATGYGTAFDASATLSGSGNEELQMLNGQYRYPTGNYTGSLPVAGPNYTTVPNGTYNNMRWVTLNLGSVSAASNLTLTFTNSSNFNAGGSPMTNFALYVRVNGATPTAGWVDGNAAYPGVGTPTNNGDAALVVASSTSTVKLVTFGTNTKTGTVYVRVGIPSGDNKRFTNITMTSA